MVKSLVEHDLQLISNWKDVQVIECSKRPYSFGLFNCSKDFHFRIYGSIERKDGDQTFQDIPNLKQKPYWGNLHFLNIY